MALKLAKTLPAETIKVITRIDDAIESDYDDFDDEYKKYLETLDESLLKFKGDKEPTRFILKKHLKYDEHYDIRSKQLKSGGNKKESTLNVAFIFDEVKIRLVGIENPSAEEDCLVYKADGSGGASKETMEKVISLGIVDDLYFAINNQVTSRGMVDKKK